MTEKITINQLLAELKSNASVTVITTIKGTEYNCTLLDVNPSTIQYVSDKWLSICDSHTHHDLTIPIGQDIVKQSDVNGTIYRINHDTYSVSIVSKVEL